MRLDNFKAVYLLYMFFYNDKATNNIFSIICIVENKM